MKIKYSIMKLTKLIASPNADIHRRFFIPNILAAGAVIPAADVITNPIIMVDILDDNEEPVASKIVSA